MRSIAKERETKETTIQLFLNLDGGEVRIASGIGFFDHMLTALAVHAGWGLVLNCEGDTWVDGHHSVEDIGIVLGQALADLVDKTCIQRYGSAYIPMDEALYGKNAHHIVEGIFKAVAHALAAALAPRDGGVLSTKGVLA